MARYDRRDHYHQRAKREGFRSRAAYKLLEIQEREGLLREGQRVVDLGCWPGGWLQVASRAVGPRGLVVGVDRAEIEPRLENENVVAICGDLEDPGICEQILELLGGRPADVVLSDAALRARVLESLGGPADVLLCDAAPKLTGVRPTDRAREEALLEAVEAALPSLLRPGGTLLLKILEGPEAQAIERRIRGRFERARAQRPRASRKGTTERYLLARGHRAAQSSES